MKVAAISGSLRSGSYNRKLLRIAMRIAASHGAEVTELDLREFDLAVYDHDIETAGMPENVMRFKEAIEAADVIIFASPEYNHSIPGGLKNAIDWASRGENSFKDKYGAIMGASDGRFGTVRMQPDLRKVLATVGVTLLPQPQIAVSNADDAFDEDGSLRDQRTLKNMELLIKNTIDLAKMRS